MTEHPITQKEIEQQVARVAATLPRAELETELARAVASDIETQRLRFAADINAAATALPQEEYPFQITAREMCEQMCETAQNALNRATLALENCRRIADDLRAGIDKKAQELRDLEHRLAALDDGQKTLAEKFHNGGQQ